MKLDRAEHTSRPWRIHEIASDFTLLDVWGLPVRGNADEFDDVLGLVTSADPANLESFPARLLWQIRDRVGDWFGLGRISAPVAAADATKGLDAFGTNQISLADRLSRDLRGSAKHLRFAALPFVPLYRTDVEFVAELSNKTVHGLMHLGWVERSDGVFTAQMAVYAQPRGRFGASYMRLIEPFRQLIVYPALMRQIERTWNSRGKPGLKVVS